MHEGCSEELANGYALRLASKIIGISRSGRFELVFLHSYARYCPTVSKEISGTHQKALRINLDSSKYGAFVEIGAGQEVARWFFRVGGASGTIAKTMSAYDMTISDA